MQTKRGSRFEVVCNIGSGVITSMVLWNFLFVPLFATGFDYKTLDHSFLITVTFTIVSIFRSYFWRRLFNWLEWKEIVS